MRKTLHPALIALLLSSPLAAQSWSIGAGTGPFIFGDFYHRTGRFLTETGSADARITLSAATRAGATVDVEHDLTGPFAVRAQATFTHAPLSLKTGNGNGISLQTATLDATTFALPLICRINRNGAFRFHLAAGPAYAIYDIQPKPGASGALTGSRGRWGFIGGGGVTWWLGRRFGVSGELADIVTSSPFKRSEFPSTTRNLELPKPHNVHTTAGVRYRF
ncbi:MAG TPA: hypothetical protein VJ032_02365 [Thermoanaerobaculia bacterium]|nr:hypothetical protein [Thermoanaerobaculia bacterium]